MNGGNINHQQQQQQQFMMGGVGGPCGPSPQMSSSSPQLMNMNNHSMSTTPSPRAPSAGSSPHPYQQQQHQHTPNASPLPHHFIPQSRTPPASQMQQIQSPKSYDVSYQCYDAVDRLKNRIENYRNHHEQAQSKDTRVMDQTYQKMKVETNRLRKQMLNESNTTSKSRKANSAAGGAGPGGGGRSRNGANKRNAAAAGLNSLDQSSNAMGPGMSLNSPNMMQQQQQLPNMVGPGMGGPVTPGLPGLNEKQVKAPKPAPKRRRQSKAQQAAAAAQAAEQQAQRSQQQIDGTGMMPNSGLMMNSSDSNGSMNSQGRNMYKFNSASPGLMDVKPQFNSGKLT